MRLYLVRHGESSANTGKLISGLKDVPLTDLGHEQAQQAAHQLAAELKGQPVRVFSSPLQRALHTARHIAHALGTDVKIEHGLRERDFGAWEGRNGDELRHEPGYILKDGKRALRANEHWRPEGGESLADVQERAVPVIHKLRQYNPDHHLILVSHGHLIRAVKAWKHGSWQGAKRVLNAEITNLGESRAESLLRLRLRGLHEA